MPDDESFGEAVARRVKELVAQDGETPSCAAVVAVCTACGWAGTNMAGRACVQCLGVVESRRCGRPPSAPASPRCVWHGGTTRLKPAEKLRLIRPRRYTGGAP